MVILVNSWYKNFKRYLKNPCDLKTKFLFSIFLARNAAKKPNENNVLVNSLFKTSNLLVLL